MTVAVPTVSNLQTHVVVAAAADCQRLPDSGHRRDLSNWPTPSASADSRCGLWIRSAIGSAFDGFFVGPMRRWADLWRGGPERRLVATHP